MVCRYDYPKDPLDPVEAAEGHVRQDRLRPGLYNLFLARNDPLLNSFEEHVLLANLGNIDWRPLVNLWAVLLYLTKYAGKSGTGTRHLASVFDSVLQDIYTHEQENGQADLWRRTILKFYNRVLGDRDYTLFEVVRHGLRLPPILSSFGDVHKVSLSSWRSLESSAAITAALEDEPLVSLNKRRLQH